MSSDLALTSPVAVIRLHGRNVQGFMKQLRGQAPTVAEKYGYLYDSTEIAEIVARGRGLDGQASRIYFKLNNNVGDAPAINGVQIRELLGQDTADRAQVEAEWRQRRRPARSPDVALNPRARITHQKAEIPGRTTACRSTSMTVGDVVAG